MRILCTRQCFRARKAKNGDRVIIIYCNLKRFRRAFYFRESALLDKESIKVLFIVFNLFFKDAQLEGVEIGQ